MASKVIGSVSLITRFMLRNNKNLSNGCCQCLGNGSSNSVLRALATARTPVLSTFAKSFSTNIVQQCSVPKIEDEPDELYKRLTIEVKGHDHAVLKSYGKFLNMTTRELGITVESQQVPKKHVKRYTLLKSVHIYKKHRVQYETRTYFHIMKIKHVTGSTTDTFLEYIQRNLPEGVAMKVTRERLESLPSHLSSVPSAASQSVS